MYCYLTYCTLSEFLARYDVFGFGSHNHNPDSLAILIERECAPDYFVM